MNARAARAGWFAALFAALATIALASPFLTGPTDRGVYEASATYRIVPDCSELHCFRLLVPWVLGVLPGPSLVRWRLYAAACNAAAAVVSFNLALTFGLSRRGAMMTMLLSAFGFGSLFTLHDPYTADPLMYWLGPLITDQLLRGRIAVAGVVSTIGVLGKEFAAAPIFVFSAYAAWARQGELAARVLAWALLSFLVWLAVQLVLTIGFNYSYADNPSTNLLGGGYLAYWIERSTPRAIASAMFDEFGPLYVLAPVGLLAAPTALRRLALLSLPVACVFAYVQQPDRALWNFHYLVIPLAALVLERASAALAWSLVACFGLANLRVGAQIAWVPASRYALVASLLLATAAIVSALRNGAGAPGHAPVPVESTR